MSKTETENNKCGAISDKINTYGIVNTFSIDGTQPVEILHGFRPVGSRHGHAACCMVIIMVMAMVHILF